MTSSWTEELERLAPRLRMICNSDAEVNTLRSVMSGSVESQVKSERKYRAASRGRVALGGASGHVFIEPGFAHE